MTTSNVVSTAATQQTTTGGSYALGFNFTISTNDYALFVQPGLQSGAILSVLHVMMSVYGTTLPGMVDGANIEQPQPAVHIPSGGNHIVGPVLIDNNFEGGLSVDDWNIVFTNLGNPQPSTNIYGLVTSMLTSANWLAAGGLASPGVSNVPYVGNDRREVKLGRASKFYSQYVHGSTLPGTPGTLSICGTGNAGGTNGQVFFNKAYNISTYPDTAGNPMVVTELPMVVSTLTSTPVQSSPIGMGGGNLEPYAQALLQAWMKGTNINTQFQAVTNAWTGYVKNVSGTATFGSTYGTNTRDLCHYANLARATGLWSTATNGQTVLTQVFNALDALILGSTSSIKALPQSFTITNGNIITDSGNALPEANMQYLLARNPFASNNPNGWFHP